MRAAAKSIDDQLIELAAQGLSAEEISQRIGHVLSPARVVVKTKELLRAGDWLSERERERAFLLLLQRTVSDMRSSFMADSIDSRKLELSYIKEIFARMDKRQAATEIELSTYTANVGRHLGQVVDMALSYMRGALREEVDPQKWDALVVEALHMAWVEIETKQVQD